jgi:uncharacterized UBP type Zn finger protein
MSDQEPKQGSSKELNEAKDTSKEDLKNMKLSEYLALTENKGANLVQPLKWCPHLEIITTETLTSNFDVQKAACEECGHVGENWICLICLSIHCSRYVNEHMLIHGAEKEHPLTLSFSDISVWCYTCNDYIDNAKLYNFKNVVHKSKFGEDIPRTSGNQVVELQLQ